MDRDKRYKSLSTIVGQPICRDISHHKVYPQALKAPPSDRPHKAPKPNSQVDPPQDTIKPRFVEELRVDWRHGRADGEPS